ncbi:hypothetical protein EVAR_5848_1 [Eumeta japonica]|uniref:Uncharacterized protein n=1 Tax=Eumeta variegata TaxID=151549 RepID=A0A4C1TBU7_EUMVA|nr:hypothetical protein EVAR_5848_1 [Eumeta japonica]
MADQMLRDTEVTSTLPLYVTQTDRHLARRGTKQHTQDRYGSLESSKVAVVVGAAARVVRAREVARVPVQLRAAAGAALPVQLRAAVPAKSDGACALCKTSSPTSFESTFHTEGTKVVFSVEASSHVPFTSKVAIKAPNTLW